MAGIKSRLYEGMTREEILQAKGLGHLVKYMKGKKRKEIPVFGNSAKATKMGYGASKNYKRQLDEAGK